MGVSEPACALVNVRAIALFANSFRLRRDPRGVHETRAVAVRNKLYAFKTCIMA